MPAYRHLDADGETPITGVAYGQIKAGRVIDRAGTAQGGAAGYITLDAGAPTASDSFRNCYVAITAGTGAGQIKPVASYNGSNKQLAITGSFSPTPNGTSVFRVFLANRYAVQNVSGDVLAGVTASEVVSGGSDGVQFPRWALDTVALSCPFNVAAVSGGTGGVWSGTGAKYYRLTGVKNSGETTGSVEVAVNVAATTEKVTLTWDALPGSPDNIKVYRSETAGVYTTPALRTTLSGATVTFLDDGTAVGAGALPSANTSGGYATAPYGVPPVLAADDLDIGDLANGQQAFYWEEPLVAGGTPSGQRLWARRFEEVT